MKENHISILTKIKYRLKKQIIYPVRDYLNPSGDKVLYNYEADHYIVSSVKKVTKHDMTGREYTKNVPDDNITIIDSKGNTYLNKNRYIFLKTSKTRTALYMPDKMQFCIFDYNYPSCIIKDIYLSLSNIEILSINNNTYYVTHHESTDENFELYLKSKELDKSYKEGGYKRLTNIFDDRGIILFADVENYHILNNGLDKYPIFTKDDNFFIYLGEEKGFINADLLCYVNKEGHLPMLLGTKEYDKNSKITSTMTFSFLSESLKLNSDIKIKDIDKGNDHTIYKIINTEGKIGYINASSGNLVIDKWFHQGTNYENSRAFAKTSHTAFYKMYNEKGNEVELDQNVKIQKVLLHFGYLKASHYYDPLAMLQVREFHEDKTYIDKTVYVTKHGKIIDI